MTRQMQLWKHDFMEGIWKRKVYLLFPVFVALVSCISLHAKMEGYIRTGDLEDYGSFMDYWIYFIQGGKAYKFSWYNTFTLPVRWLCIQVFLLISLNNYAFNDMQNWGYQVLTRSKSRFNWWFGKELWCMVYTGIYYIICLGSVAAYTTLQGIPLQLRPTRQATLIFSKMAFYTCGFKRLLCIVIVLPVLLSVFLGLLQMLLSMCIKPILSFLSVLFVLVVSVYRYMKILPGNWGMPYRIAPIKVKGMLVEVCLVLLVSGVILLVAVGYEIFKRQDILEKG